MNELVPDIPATPYSPLLRLIDTMIIRHLSRETQRNYIRDVGRFATFLGSPPDTATSEDLRRLQVRQRETGMPVPTMNSIVAALRFFFAHTLHRPDLARRLMCMKQMHKLPAMLSRELLSTWRSPFWAEHLRRGFEAAERVGWRDSGFARHRRR